MTLGMQSLALKFGCSIKAISTEGAVRMWRAYDTFDGERKWP